MYVRSGINREVVGALMGIIIIFFKNGSSSVKKMKKIDIEK
jgi:hypothetical protein